MNFEGEAPLVIVIGRYLKQSRAVSQSPWVIEGKRRYSMSVEEAVGEPLRVMFQASTYKFLAAGREDADVRMLGRGRPFAVELRGCRRGPEVLQQLIDGHLSVQCDQHQTLQEEQQPQGDTLWELQFSQRKHHEQQQLQHSKQKQGHQQERQQQQERDKERESLKAARAQRDNRECRLPTNGSHVAVCNFYKEQGCQPGVCEGVDRDRVLPADVAGAPSGGAPLPPRAVPALLASAAHGAAGAATVPAAACVPGHASIFPTVSAAVAAAPPFVPADGQTAPDTFCCRKRPRREDQQRTRPDCLATTAEEASDCSSFISSTVNSSDSGESGGYGVKRRITSSRSTISSNSGNSLSKSDSSSKDGLCRVCVAVLGEPYSTSCLRVQCGDPATWEKRVLRLCPFLVYPQQQLSEEPKVKQVQEVELQEQHEPEATGWQDGDRQQQPHQQLHEHATVQQQQQQEIGELHVTAQHLPHQGIENLRVAPGLELNDTRPGELRGDQKSPRHHCAPVGSQGRSKAALSCRLADRFSLQLLNKEAGGAQAGATSLSQSPGARKRKEAGTEEGETAGSCVSSFTCDLSPPPSFSGFASPSVAAYCPCSNGVLEKRSFFFDGQRNVFATPAWPALGATPAVVVVGVRVVLPRGQQHDMEQTLYLEKQERQPQTQTRQQQHHREIEEQHVHIQKSLQLEAREEGPVAPAVAQKLAEEAEELPLARRPEKGETVCDGGKKGGDCSSRRCTKRVRLGKEVRLALQHGAEEKVKRYEALVFAQSPVTPQQLEDLQIRYFPSSGRNVRTRLKNVQKADIRTAADDAASAAGGAWTPASVGGVAAVREGAVPGGFTAAGGAPGKEMEGGAADFVERGRGAAGKHTSGGPAAEKEGTNAAAADAKGLGAAAETGGRLILFQKTPLRVLHRRSLAERQRAVYAMEFTFLHPHLFVCHLATQAGTYIKEFVHGDYGRTTPSLSSLLHTRCRVLLLDVVDLIVGSVVFRNSNNLQSGDRRSSGLSSNDDSVTNRSNGSSVNSGNKTNVDISSGCVIPERSRSSNNFADSSSGTGTSHEGGGYRTSLAEGNTLLDC